ncbi:ABC transporter permease [Calycomorphotria hydatis]|uniref:ABC-2 family transporter protein n=1 Tax=Calycomorphotria hydatis TaxID=2528027 RepID=A0A517T8U9_9PLAN|nr:ABC transporter permease [Calycomorphotria hydatis]QDT64811.1 ABC-2 family transporter protein [Calycomorphotria hydatis]
MTGVFALFARSLKADSGGWKGHVFRLAFAGMIAFSLVTTNTTLGAPGLNFFRYICWLNVFFIGLAGISFFATAVTEEKEEGTLGLLRMAGISYVGILLGKSTSRLMAAMLLLMVQFPFFLLAITLGGVLPNQIIAAAIALFAYLAFVANVGLLFSVLCKKSGSAVALTGFVLLLYFLIPTIASPLQTSGLVWQGVPLSGVAGFVSEVSIATRIQNVLTTNFANSPLGVQVYSNLAMGFICFLIGWLVFGLGAHEEQSSEPTRTSPKGGRWRAFAPRRVWSNPFAWREYFFMAGGLPIIVGKAAVYLIVSLGIWFYMKYTMGPAFDFEDASWVLICAAVIAFVGETCRMAANLYRDEVHQKNLESLILLTVPFSRISLGKVLGCLPALLPVFVFLIASCFSSAETGEGTLELFANPYFWVGVALYLVFMHVVVLTSLFVRWGAVPIAVLMTIFASYAVMPLLLFSFMLSEAFESHIMASIPMLGMAVGGCIALQMAIHRRLIVLGGR